MSIEGMVALVVALGLVFTYTNGFQDGSSVAASAIASRGLTRTQTILLVSTFELLGALLGGSAVAGTIANVSTWPADPTLLPVLASALAAAIFWNYMTRLLGVPSSSTHALIGGLLGAVLAGSGSFHYIQLGNVGGLVNATGLSRIIISLFMSPLCGFAVGYVVLILSVLLLRRASNEVNDLLKKAQWFAVPLLAFGHGANDSQKTMGLIVLALYSAGLGSRDQVPFWVRALTGITLALGVVSLAPRIVKRVGGIYPMRPLHGLVAEASSGLIVLIASLTGGPLAASQVIASTVIGVGTAERKKGVQWVIAREMVRAWCLTIPSAGIVAFIFYSLIFRHLSNFASVGH
ncbi:MAG: inorganic phosphate transporter [Candidatus Melainabacteria bacterium]|nr:inorganic phosphate transporter [Candidatus Melainabacteria bacterium]